MTTVTGTTCSNMAMTCVGALDSSGRGDVGWMARMMMLSEIGLLVI